MPKKDCQKNTGIIIKMVGKICYKELEGSFKAYIKRQDAYCLMWKKQTDNKSITPEQVANELIAQESLCVDCGSKKSIFIQEYKPNKKQ